jgi:uncharacterized membrane protein
MSDIYATPGADLGNSSASERAGGAIEDAIAGNIEIDMLATLGEAWRGLKGFKLKCHIALVLYLLVFLAAAILFGLVVFALAQSGADPQVIEILGIVFQLVITLVALPMTFAILVMGVRHARDKSVSAGEVFRHFRSIPSLFLAYVLQTILIILGLILLVVPGIYLMFAYIYAMPLIVEKKMSAWQALETSRKAITRVWFRFFGITWLLSLINMLGVLTLGIAWFWTIPWTVLAYAMIYFKLFGAEAHTLAD